MRWNDDLASLDWLIFDFDEIIRFPGDWRKVSYSWNGGSGNRGSKETTWTSLVEWKGENWEFWKCADTTTIKFSEACRIQNSSIEMVTAELNDNVSKSQSSGRCNTRITFFSQSLKQIPRLNFHNPTLTPPADSKAKAEFYNSNQV